MSHQLITNQFLEVALGKIIEADLYYEVMFNGRHCYKYQPKGSEIVIVSHERKEEALRIILEKLNSEQNPERSVARDGDSSTDAGNQINVR